MEKEEVKSKEKFKKYLEKEMNHFFSSVLDYAEIAVDGKERFKSLRAKILRVGNEKIRDICKEVDCKYTLKYNPNEDVINVKSK